MDYKLYKADETKRAELKRIISQALAARDDIGFAYLFGSFVDGSEAFRDIDVGVYFLSGDSRENVQNGIELAVELTSKTAIEVDVRPLNSAPSTFIFKVLQGELIDNTDDDLRCRVTERTLREYFDIQPILQRAMKEAYSS
jgi:predicted nucleotidyltransferase